MSNAVDTGYQGAFAITPGTDKPFAAVYVGGAGNVSITPAAGGAAVVFTAPPVGSIIPLAGSGVTVANTTATLLIGLV